MAALGIARAIKDLISCHVDGRGNLTQDAKAGDQGLWLQRTDEYVAGETIVLRDNDKAEFHTIACIKEVEKHPVLVLCEDVTAPFVAVDSWVQKTHNKQIIEDIVLGNPDHLDNYPSITIQPKNMIREPLTIETVSDMFTFEIGVWMDATTYTAAYESLLIITDKVERALFRRLAPLVEPFFATVLSEDASGTDTVIKVANGQGIPNGALILLENIRGIRRHNRVVSNDGNGVLVLAFGVAFPYIVGDSVVRPLVHLYDPKIESISYDDAQDQDHLLKSSTVAFSVKMQRPRRA